jgi:superfamily II DNA or RNA helicase
MKLYPYQEKIIDQIRKALYEKYKSILIVLPTGGGKTLIFSSIAKKASDKGNRILILTHRKEILEQTLAKLYLFGIIAGQVASGKPMTRDLIQVAMIQTAVHRLGIMKKPDLIIIDECHHANANTWTKTINYFGNIPRLGFSATPEDPSGAGLIKMFEYMIEGPTINQLVKEDYLSYPVMFSPEKEHTQKFHIKRGDFI